MTGCWLHLYYHITNPGFFFLKKKLQNYSNAFLKNKSRPRDFKGLNPRGNREMLVSNVYFNYKSTRRL